ncbi:MAG: zinc ribbon domain-containing protein [Sterolibacterium sp.]|jgi:hypothetical protein|nr:zinc ribbon domain-containing protein [Sterolibacterium sp.]MBP9799623.1 zinc ribbon domain-containing protein [Sterolibacterium sp.]
MQCPHCQAEVTEHVVQCPQCGAKLVATPAKVPAPAAGGASYQSNFGDQFNASLIIWKMNLGDLAVLTLVLMLVGWIPIANIGFFAGYARAILKVMRGEGRAEVGDLFNAWDCFGNLLIYAIIVVIAAAIVGVVPVLGALASAAIGFAALPGFYLIIDRRSDFTEAIKWAIATIQARPVDWFLSYIVGMIISWVGMLLFFIGVILTAPLGALVLSQQYDSSKPS